MDFHTAFQEIDTDGSGEISIEELNKYMAKKNYTKEFVDKWLNLFDLDGDGSITYEEYCTTLGLAPKQQAEKPHQSITASSAKTTKSAAGKSSNDEEKSTARRPRLYKDQVGPKPLHKKNSCVSKHVHNNLRASIRPGVVLILLAGRHRGKRVVFLRQLASGLLLVTGPLKINGVPLRRVSDSMVIATSTSVDVSSVLKDTDIVNQLNDSSFSRTKAEKNKDEIFTENKAAYKPNENRKSLQEKVDNLVCQSIKTHSDSSDLKRYLRTAFKLYKNDAPHKMKF